jgi:hypothetical protein
MSFTHWLHGAYTEDKERALHTLLRSQYASPHVMIAAREELANLSAKDP